MKVFEFVTEKKTFRNFKSIREKKDIILLLLETISKLLIDSKEIRTFNDFEVIKNQEIIKIIIYIDKMKRLFYCTENRIQSIGFPFTFLYVGDEVKFFFKDTVLDFTKLSILISVFENSSLINAVNLVDILLDEDAYQSLCVEEQQILEELVLFLSIFEDGYLRFDFCDEENFVEKFHPLHHIDIYYTNYNTFKLGLDNEMSIKKNIEILDIKQKCFNIK